MAISSLNSDWTATYGNKSVPVSTYAGPSLTPSSGGGGGRPSLTPTSSGGGGSSVPQWQQNLQMYKSNPAAGYAEIARAGNVWNQKLSVGDAAGAEAAHTWANQIRDALGVSGYYDRGSGGSLTPDPLRQSLGTLVPNQKTDPYGNYLTPPPTPQYERDRYTPVSAPYPSLKLSSGSETIVPTMEYQRMQYGLQNDMAKRIYDQGMLDYNLKQYERQKIADEAKRIHDEAQLEVERKKADAAMISANRPSGSGGGLTGYQQYQIGRNEQQDKEGQIKSLDDAALARAKADPRLAQYKPADGVTTFTLDALIQAHKISIMLDRAKANGYNGEEIKQSLAEMGLNPSDYGY